MAVYQPPKILRHRRLVDRFPGPGWGLKYFPGNSNPWQWLRETLSRKNLSLLSWEEENDCDSFFPQWQVILNNCCIPAASIATTHYSLYTRLGSWLSGEGGHADPYIESSYILGLRGVSQVGHLPSGTRPQVQYPALPLTPHSPCLTVPSEYMQGSANFSHDESPAFYLCACRRKHGVLATLGMSIPFF